MAQSPTVENLLSDMEDDIIRIKRRLAYLLPLSAELELRAGAPRFTVRNDIVYQMFTDSYDMVVIDLASLCRGMIAPKGFFNKLNNHLRSLKRPSLKTVNVPQGVVSSSTMMTAQEQRELSQQLDEHFRRSVKAGVDASFERLFPGVVVREQSPRPRWWNRWLKRRPSKVTQEDIQALKDKFEELTMAVVRDRDARRAHRYEKRKADRSTQMLGLKDIAEHFEKVEQVVNDLRLVTVGSHFLYNPPILSNIRKTAEHLTDIILLGGIWHIVDAFGIDAVINSAQGAPFKYYWQYRDAFYAKKSGTK